MIPGLDSIAGLIGTIGAGIGSAIGRGISSFASGLNQPLGGDEEEGGDKQGKDQQCNPQDSVNINFGGIQSEAQPMNMPSLGWLGGGQQ